jgi:hypothetical protein
MFLPRRSAEQAEVMKEGWKENLAGIAAGHGHRAAQSRHHRHRHAEQHLRWQRGKLSLAGTMGQNRLPFLLKINSADNGRQLTVPI